MWEIIWFENRHRRRRSTGTDDRREAEKALGAFLLEEQNKKPARASDPDDRPIAEVLALYGAEQAVHLKSGTTIGFNIETLLKFWGKKNVGEVTRTTCSEYVKSRSLNKNKVTKKTGIGQGTIVRELGVLQTAINHDFKMRRLTNTVFVWRPPTPKPKDRWLTRQEAARLLRAARAPTRHDEKTGRVVTNRARAWLPKFILMALYSSARKEAIYELKWNKVDLERRIIDFNGEEPTRRQKRRAIIPIPTRLYGFLRRWKKQGTNSGFVLSFNGHAIGDVKKSLQRIAKEAGLPNVSAHTFRHTAATWMTQAGVDMMPVSKYLGHSSVKTTERVYAHHHPDYLHDARDALDFGHANRAKQILAAPLAAPSSEIEIPEPLLTPWKGMVGATGFEPVTPTMSR